MSSLETLIIPNAAFHRDYGGHFFRVFLQRVGGPSGSVTQGYAVLAIWNQGRCASLSGLSAHIGVLVKPAASNRKNMQSIYPNYLVV